MSTVTQSVGADTPLGSRNEIAKPQPPEPPVASNRLQALDAYRGLIMISLAFVAFGLRGTAENHLATAPDSGFWKLISRQFEHVDWAGMGYWDMIQPSFMFMVGVSMAYSYVRRQREGQSWVRMFGHACWRSVALVALGIFLTSNGSRGGTNWQFMNVLSQIGLGYPFLFLLWGRSLRTHTARGRCTRSIPALASIPLKARRASAYPLNGHNTSSRTSARHGTKTRTLAMRSTRGC